MARIQKERTMRIMLALVLGIYWQFSWVSEAGIRRESPLFYMQERCEYARTLVQDAGREVTECTPVNYDPDDT